MKCQACPSVHASKSNVEMRFENHHRLDDIVQFFVQTTLW